jgi:hypothetical protein
MRIFSVNPELIDLQYRYGAGALLRICLAFSVFLLPLIIVAGAEAGDWVRYCRYQDVFYYDRESVAQPYDNFKTIKCVRQKTVYEAKSTARIAAHLGPKYAYLKESISMIEIDCLTRKAQTKSTTFYDSRGVEIESTSRARPDWKLITDKSPPLDILYKILCPPEE